MDNKNYRVIPCKFCETWNIPKNNFRFNWNNTAPLIHADFNHLLPTFPLLFLGVGISYSYPSCSKKLFAGVYILHGLLVWIIARQAYHIGASGLVYGLVSFLFFSGIIRRDNRSIALALIVTFLYGGLTWGVLPIKAEISWEAHLFGSIVGIIFAYIFRKADPAPKYDWEDEESTRNLSNQLRRNFMQKISRRKCINGNLVRSMWSYKNANAGRILLRSSAFIIFSKVAM
jgi:hypothetical protein